MQHHEPKLLSLRWRERTTMWVAFGNILLLSLEPVASGDGAKSGKGF
jgi:hypothetical protein